MKKRKTNIEMLCWGIKHIANNHGFYADTAYEDEGEVCIYGGCNVPTLADVRMLCEDLGIESKFIDSNDCGIDVWIPADWMENESGKQFDGMCLWKRN